MAPIGYYRALHESLYRAVSGGKLLTAETNIKRGQEADLWQTAVSLLQELTEQGWGNN